jgi:hypothetical protein
MVKRHGGRARKSSGTSSPFINNATAGGHQAGLLDEAHGHLCFPEPHRHVAKNAKKQAQDPRAKRRAMALEALRRTLAMLAADLTGWVTERVARLEPEAERDPSPVDTREEELKKLIAKVRLHVAHQDMGKAAGELPGVTALQEGETRSSEQGASCEWTRR